MLLEIRAPPEDAPPEAVRAFDEGVKALTDARWHDACSAFQEASALHATWADAWAGVATAAYWVPDEDLIMDARERAHHLYRGQGDQLRAGLMAAWLAVDALELRGQAAIANGWMQRANRLIEKHRVSAEGACVSLLNTRLLMLTGADSGVVRRLAARAAALARRLDLPDAEALSLSAEGHARLNIGDIQQAIKCLDESAALVLSRECTNLTMRALTLCSLMGACERVRDFERARQWCSAARQFSEDRGFPVILSICRPHYAAVLMWRGQWPEAEEHLQVGRRELMEFMPPFAVGAQALLAGLRWRQGRWDEAEEIFEQIKHEPAAQVGLAELIAGKGDHAAASELLERHLRTIGTGDKLERGPALELIVRCLAATGELEKASAYMDELRELAASVGSTSLGASAAFAEGILAGAAGDRELARQRLADAGSLFARAGSPFDSARARLALAEVLFGAGQAEAGLREAQTARETFVDVGASTEAQRAGELLASMSAKHGAGELKNPDGLTARESEILALLAEGQSNQQIADSLVLSVRTVERHISNIYEKLGLDGRTARTAAAAYAHRSSAVIRR
jgi:ATP/maltotriose-dependent transcriptional regulator MalT